MKKAIVGIIGAAILTVGAIFVVGQHKVNKGEHFGGKGHRGMIGMALMGLDLTDEQKAKVKEIMETTRTSVEPLREQMKANHIKIRDLSTDGTFDQAAVEALANEQGSITAKLIIEKEKAKAQVFAILTDEQKAKAAEMRAKFEERMKGRKHFGKAPSGAEF
jgi:protein CpxP